jgi:hypothetical protein
MDLGSKGQPPFFHGIEVHWWNPYRYFRIYIRPKKLYFIFMDIRDSLLFQEPHHISVHLMHIWVSWLSRPTKKLQARLERMQRLPPEELLQDHRYSFCAVPSEISGARIDPFTLWRTLWYTLPARTGLFRFRHSRLGKYRIAFNTDRDMKLAVDLLPKVFDRDILIDATGDY